MIDVYFSLIEMILLRIIQWVVSLIIFGIVFGLAMSNPKVRRNERANFVIDSPFRDLKLFLNKREVFFKISKWESFLPLWFTRSPHTNTGKQRKIFQVKFDSNILFSNYILPFQLPRWFIRLQWIIPVYFISAVVYDIYHITRSYLK